MAKFTTRGNDTYARAAIGDWEEERKVRKLKKGETYETDESGKFTRAGLGEYFRSGDPNVKYYDESDFNKEEGATNNGPSSNVPSLDQRLANNNVKASIPKTAGNYSPEKDTLTGYERFLGYKSKYDKLQKTKETEEKIRKENADYSAYKNEKANALENMDQDQFDALSRYNDRVDFYRARGGAMPSADNLSEERQAAVDAGIPEDKIEKYAQYVKEKNNERKTNERNEKVKEALNDDTPISKAFNNGLKAVGHTAAGFVSIANPILGAAANYAVDNIPEGVTKGDVANLAAAAGDILASPVAGMSINETFNKMNYADKRAHVDTNSNAYALQNLSNTVEQTQKEGIENKINSTNWSEGSKNILNTIAQGAYDLSMTTSKAALSMAIGQAAGSVMAAGITDSEAAAKVIKSVANIVTLPSYGTSSYAQTLKEGYERGLSESQAQSTAFVAGAAEMLTELVSLDYVLDVYNKGGKKLLKEKIADVLLGSAVEGSEEFFNDVINTIADSLINGDKSELNMQVEELKKSGMSDSEAKKTAFKEWGVNAAKDFAMGMASGLLLTGGASMLSGRMTLAEARELHRNSSYKEIEDSIETDPSAYATKEQAEVAKKTKELYGKLAQKAENGEKIKDHEQQSAYELLQETLSNAEKVVTNEEDNLSTEEQKAENGQNIASEGKENIQENTQELTEEEKAAQYNTLKAMRTAETPAELVAAEKEAKAAGFDTGEVAKMVGRVSQAKNFNMDEVHELEAQPTVEEARKMGENGLEAPINMGIKEKIAFTEGKMKAIKDLQNSKPETALKESVATYNGEEIKIKDITENGEYVTDKGNIPATKVQFKDKAAEFLYNTALNYKGKARQEFINDYNSNSSTVGSYAVAFESIYNAGSMAKDFKQYFNNHKSLVNEIGFDTAAKIYDIAFNENKESRKKNPGAKNAKKQGGSVKDIRKNKPEGRDVLLETAQMLSNKLPITIILGADTGTANGEFNGSKILVKEGTGVELRTLYHEMGEFVKSYGNEKFDDLRDSVINWYSKYKNEAFDKIVKDYYNAYSSYYEELNEKDNGNRSITMGEAADEVVFDALVNICLDEKVADNFVAWAYDTKGAESESFLTKFKDFINEFFDHLREFIGTQSFKEHGEYLAANATKEELTNIQNTVLDAIDAAVKNYQKEAYSDTATDAGVAASYSLMEFPDGKRFVSVDTDQELFDNLTPTQQLDMAKLLIKEKFQGKIVGQDNKMFVNGVAAGEYARPLVNISDDIKEAKARVSGELDNLIDAGYNFRNESDGKDGHFHKYNVGGFDYFDVIFKIGNEFFTGKINVENVTKGKKFKDITEIKNTTQEQTNSYGKNPMFRFLRSNSMPNITNIEANSKQSLEVDTEGNKLSEGQREYFKNAKTVDEEGRLKRYYHGTGRADRVGTVFKPERATSGPMAFFTDDKNIADAYAKDKSDTSLSYDEDYNGDYLNRFVVDLGPISTKIGSAWGYVPMSDRPKMKEKAKHIVFDEDWENIIYDENATRGLGNFDDNLVKRYGGNVFKALVDSWLNSGELFENEEKFLDVLKLVGYDKPVKYNDPFARDEKTYEVYLNITNPFITEEISDEMLEKLRYAARVAVYDEEANMQADGWDKRGITPEEWMRGLEEDIKNDTTYSWTRIPDWVTDSLKAAGYDGIFDRGGKFHDQGHQVVIPFNSEQIKNVDNEDPTKDPDIRYSLEIDSDGNKLSEGQREYFKDTKVVDEDGDLLKMYHGTVSDFTVFDRKYGNVEGDWGKGFYFTNMEYDADDNYGNEGGQDLTIKIERLAEQLEWEEGFEDADYDERLEEAKKRLITGEAHTLSVYLNVTNPVYIRDNNSTLLFADLYDDIDYEEFEDEDEYYEALDNALADKYAYIEEKLNEAGFEDLGDVGSALYQAAEEGGVTAQQLKDMINQYHIGDDEGNLAGNEITRIIVEALGYDGIIDETVSTKFKGMHLDPDTKHIIVFNSNQAKNTDNLNPTENKDIRYSLKVDDQSYMAAVDNGDMETAQKMVDAYAKQTRWNSEKLYHGSDQFGFTVIDPTKGDDNISFFATNSEEIASTYTNGKTKEIGTKINEWKNLKGLELKKYANEHGLNIKYNFGDEQKNNLEVLKNNLSDMGWTKALEYLEDPLWKNKIIPALEDIALEDPSSNEFEKALEIIKEIEEDEEIDKHGIDFNEIKWTAIALKEAASLMFEHYGTPISEESVKIMLEQGERIGIYSLYGDTSNFMEIDGKGANWNTIGPEERGLFEAIFNVARANIAWDLEETEILEESKRSSFEEIAEKILEEEESNFTRKERFDLIHKAKRLDQMKSEYKGAISFEKYLSNQKIQNTRQLAKLAYDSGYSGVKIKNITDHGPKNFNLDAEAGDIYIFFKGQDIKSADPVTYDDKGEVIPLSKRFSEESQDIRYSLELPKYSEEVDDLFFGENELTPLLKEGAELLKSQEVDRVSVEKVAKDIIKQTNSEYDSKKLADNLEKVFAYMQAQDNISYNDLSNIMFEVAKPVVEESKMVDPQEKARYDEFVSYLKTINGVKLSDKQKQEVRNVYGTYGNFRNKLFGKLNISDNATTTLDQLWSEMVDQSNGVLESNISEGGEPVALLDALEAMKPSMITPFLGNNNEAAYDVALRILHNYYDLAGNSKEIQAYKKELRDQAQNFRDSVKANYEKRLKALTENAKWNGENVSEAILKERAKVRDAKKMQEERQAATKNREQIRKVSNQLFNMLERPTDKKHVPDALKLPVEQLLASIDFVSPRAKVDSTTTLKWQDMMRKLALDLKEITENGELMDDNSGQLASMCHIIDPDLAENMRQFVKDHEKQAKLSNLSASELNQLSRILTGLKNAIVKSNELLGQRIALDEVAKQSMREMDAKKERIDKTKFSKNFKDFFNMDMLDSISYFEELGAASNTILKEIQEGWKNKVKRVSEAQDWFTKEVENYDTKTWTGDKAQKFTFKTDEGSIELTTGQLMELYAHSKREQSRGHFTRGGIRSGADRARSNIIHITPALFDEMMSKLTKEQKDLTDKMQSYLSSEVADWGNNATMEAYGYKKFNEKNYWPIKTDSNTRNATDKNTSDNASLFAIRNMSASKNLTQGANNALVLNDAFDTFTNHVAQMASYEGLMIPLSDAMKWYNYHEQVDALDEFSSRYDYGVKDSIERAFGKAGQNYFIKLMKDINGEAAGDKVPSFISQMVSNSKAAAVSANLRVIVQQPCAISRALNEMNGKYLMQALPSIYKAKTLANEAQENSMLAKWKNWGYFDNYLGKSMKQVVTGQSTFKERVQDIAASGAQLADDLTWGVLYNAVKLEIKDTTNLDEKSQEFKDAVAKRFDEIVDRTQVVDTVFNRSQLMRNQNDLVKLSTAFMMEPSKTYNMIHRAIASGDKDKMFRAGLVYILNAIITSAAASVMDALRSDDDERDIAERYLEAMFGIGEETSGQNILTSTLGGNINPLAQIPYVKEIFSAVEGYDASRMDVAWIYDIYDALSESVKYANGSSNKTAFGVSEKIMKAAGEATGLPIYQAYREIKTAYNNVGNLVGWDNIKTKKPKTYDDLKSSMVKGKGIEGSVNQLLEEAKQSVDPNSKYYERELKEALESTKSGVGTTITNNYKKDYVEMAADPESSDFKELDANIKTALKTAGFTDDEINEKLNTWVNPKEDTTYLEWDMYDAIESGKDIESSVSTLMDAGKTKDSVSKSITSEYRDHYNELAKDPNSEEYKTLTENLTKAFMAAGYDEDDTKDKLSVWSYGDGTGTIYSPLYDAFDNGGDVQEAVKTILKTGRKESDVQGQITKTYKDKYLEKKDANFKAQLIKAYMAAGLTNAEAKKKIEEWGTPKKKKK